MTTGECIVRFIIEARQGTIFKPLVLHPGYEYVPRFDTRSEAEAMLDWLTQHARPLGTLRVTAVETLEP